jgi:POT family proton-dependent oligopeptide transporter
MRNILTPFLVSTLLLYLPESQRALAAKDVFHTFVIGVYFFPLLGGWLADRHYGKYPTIFWLSLVYCLGNLLLAVFPGSRPGFYAGLFLIALGSGGIKPLVASFVGDQFDRTNKHLAKPVFDAFYWIINFGSFFASLLMPVFLRRFGPSVAFGIPGVLMAIATLIFWLGRKQYVMLPPAAPSPDSFLRVVRTALTTRAQGQDNLGTTLAMMGLLLGLGTFAFMGRLGFVACFCLALVLALALGGWGTARQLERARGHHADEAIEGVRSVLGILILFALVTPFWSLFDQKASTWILQANLMTKPAWFEPAQMQALNPALVMVLIPFNNFVVYPFLRRFGIEPSSLARIGAGIFLSGLAWVAVGFIQKAVEAGPVAITWQILPYALLTLGEVLVSATGLEFAYSQAPPSMKGTIMSFWYLSVTIGNLWVLLVNASVRSPEVLARIASAGVSVTAFQMFFFAGFAFAAGFAFVLYARRYRMVDHYRGD